MYFIFLFSASLTVFHDFALCDDRWRDVFYLSTHLSQMITLSLALQQIRLQIYLDMGCTSPKPSPKLRDQLYKNENQGPQTFFGKRQHRQSLSSKPFSENKIYERQGTMSEKAYLDQKHCKNQDLYPVTEADMKDHLYHQRIGALLSYFSNSMKLTKGTAFLISSDLLLTSAHNLYDKKSDTQIAISKFYLGLNGDVKDFHEHEKFMYPDQFETLGSIDYDYALIKLKKPIKFSDSFRLSLAINFNNKDEDLAIFGYPGKNNYEVNIDGSIKKGFQMGLERKGFKAVEDNILAYEISTTTGQSGCPIVVGKRKDLVVGIHKGGVQHDHNEYNIARYVNIDMLIRLQIWREALKGERFNVFDMNSGEPFDLSSNMFQQMMRMLKQEQRNKLRLKKVFEGQIMNKVRQYQKLQQKIVSFGGSSSFDVLELVKQNLKMQKQIMQLNSNFKKEHCLQANLAQKLKKSIVGCYSLFTVVNPKIT